MGLNNLDDSKDKIDRFKKRNPDICFVAENENKVVRVIIAENDGRRDYVYYTWEKDYKMDEIIDKYLKHITDVKPITARQCIKLLPIVAKYKPE